MTCDMQPARQTHSNVLDYSRWQNMNDASDSDAAHSGQHGPLEIADEDDNFYDDLFGEQLP
eukprot:1052445-Karenia_brevis.AAC.1